MRTKFIYQIPILLLYSRLIVALLIVVLSFINPNPIIIVVLSIWAILSDIFDGIIARQLNISTPEMRILDTKIDTVFWFSCLLYVCVNKIPFLQNHFFQIVILVFSELFIIIIGFLKFHERISYHTIVSKFWALTLLCFFIDLIVNDSCKYTFTFSFWFGIFAQFEILWITLLLKQSQTDVPGFIQAIKIRKGLKIRKNRFFNS